MNSLVLKKKLGNGMEVLVREEHAHPLVSLQLWVRTGSCDEGYLLGSGVSHFLEHMVFKGSSRFSGKLLAEKVQEMGGSWNAYTSHTQTVFHLDGPAHAWKLFLELLVDMVMRPTLPLEEMEKEKEVVRREMAMYNDDPDSVFEHLLNQCLYKKHPRQYPILGELASFNRLTHGELSRYHQERYMPNNVFLVVAGDISAEDVFTYANEETLDLQPRPLSPPIIACEPRQWSQRIARAEFAIPSSKLALAWKIPSSHDPDYPALKVLSHILGNGNSALLYEKLHEEKGLAYDISSYITPLATGESSFIIEAELAREERESLRSAILEEVHLLSAQDFSVPLARALKQIEVSMLRQRSNVSGIASEVAESWFHAGQSQSIDEWIDHLKRLTSSDIQAVAQRYFHEDRLIEVSLDPIGSNPQNHTQVKLQAKPEIMTKKLDNGLSIIMRPDKRIPLCFCELCFMAGAPTESAINAGINALMADLLPKGTATRSCSEIAHSVENMGGSLSTNAGNNSILLSSSCLKNDLFNILEILADISIRPSFPLDALEREREAMIDEARESLEDPLSLALLELRKLCFGDQSYGNPITGTPESLASITQADILKQYTKIINSTNATLSITGDFDPDECTKVIAELFAPMSRQNPPIISPCPPFSSGDKHLIMDKEQAVLVLALPGFAGNHPQLLEANILNEWCRDMAGPIFTALREDTGLTYFASSSLMVGIDTGMLIFYLGCAPEKLSQARTLLDSVLNRLAEEGISEEEFERVRSLMLASWTLSQQSQRQIAQTMALDNMLGLAPNHFELQYEKIKNIFYTNIQNFIIQALSPLNLRCYTSISSASFPEKLNS